MGEICYAIVEAGFSAAPRMVQLRVSGSVAKAG
jgi:hypothetical protein